MKKIALALVVGMCVNVAYAASETTSLSQSDKGVLATKNWYTLIDDNQGKVLANPSLVYEVDKYVYAVPTVIIDNASKDKLLLYMAFSCTKGKAANLRTVIIKPNGKVLAGNSEKLEWESVKPNSVADYIYSGLCGSVSY